jgi:uncharacterized membrane protein
VRKRTTSSRDLDPLADIEPERAERIRRALRRGEALTDPEDAALAVAAGEQSQAAWRKARWFLLLDGALVAVALAAPLLSLISWTLALFLLAISIPGLLVTFVLVPLLAGRSAEAARRNRALLETFGSEGEAALRRARAAVHRSA